MYRTKSIHENKERICWETHRNIGVIVGRILAVLSLMILAVGCDSGDGRLEVEGAVTLDGSPVTDGSISFFPQLGTSGPTAGGKITSGQFTVKSAKGLMTGSYRVEIIASRKTGKQVKDPFMDIMVDEFVQYIPAKYNVESELTADVKEGSANQFDFQLSSE